MKWIVEDMFGSKTDCLSERAAIDYARKESRRTGHMYMVYKCVMVTTVSASR